MAMRLARPTRLIDIARLPGLAYVRDEGDEIAIGATTKQCAVEDDPLIRAKLPLLAEAMPHVGHTPTRARGTIGGSLANADPAAEIALVAVTLGATIAWREDGRSSEVDVAEFIVGPMVTSLAAGRLPDAKRGFRSGRSSASASDSTRSTRDGADFAFVAAAAQVALDADGRCARVALGIGAATAYPDPASMPTRSPAAAPRRSASSRSWMPRSPASRRWKTCTPPPPIASARRARSPCVPSSMPIGMPTERDHARRA